jgi:hypothetical protein
MKTSILQSILIASVLLACRQQDDEAILGRPEVRMDQILKEYKQRLVSSPHGWKGYIFPGLGGGFSFLFEFSSEGRVTMMADINDDCATESYESSFRLEAVQLPSLFFDTYSYLHMLSDPDPNVIGGEIGHGLTADFEFAFHSVSENGDTLRLLGNQNKTPLMLIKASRDEAQAFHSGDVKAIMNQAAGYAKYNPFVYIQSPDGKRLNTSFNLEERLFSLSLRQGDTLNISSTPFGYTTQGLFLQNPVTYRNITFQEVFFDAAASKYYVEVNGTRVNLQTAEEPVLPLHLLLGVEFSTLSIPQGGLEGSSSIFSNITGNIAYDFDAMGVGLKSIEFDFNTDNKTMNLNVFFRSYSNGFLYLARYPYAYEKSPDGVITFLRYDEPNGNGEFLEPYMAPFLTYFDNYRFRMEYLKIDAGYVSRVRCVESSAFYFSANFGSEVF